MANLLRHISFRSWKQRISANFDDRTSSKIKSQHSTNSRKPQVTPIIYEPIFTMTGKPKLFLNKKLMLVSKMFWDNAFSWKKKHLFLISRDTKYITGSKTHKKAHKPVLQTLNTWRNIQVFLLITFKGVFRTLWRGPPVKLWN